MRVKLPSSKFLTVVVMVLFVAVELLATSPIYAITVKDWKRLGTSSEFYWPEQPSSCSGGAANPDVKGTLPAVVPEPYNGAFTAGANKYKVAPALIAALFTEENFTKTPIDGLDARWKKLLTLHDANSGWPTNKFETMGAFQFIPTTWYGHAPHDPAAAFDPSKPSQFGYGVDGNNDGKRDAMNIFDGAAGAANYVAHNGATADKPPASWQNAIFAYNHAQWYVDAVMMYYNFYNSGGTSGGGAAPSSDAPATAGASQTGCAGAAVNCNSSDGQSVGSGLRSKVVCLAQAELATWKAGPPNGPAEYCKKYIDGLDQKNWCEEWCADFVSWVFNQAGYPLKQPNWRVPSVDGIRQIGSGGGKFALKNNGYTPQPGDIALHQNGSSHVNIVVAVNGTTVTMIGGDQGQGPYGGPNSKSIVSQYDNKGFIAGPLSGYVVPTGN